MTIRRTTSILALSLLAFACGGADSSVPGNPSKASNTVNAAQPAPASPGAIPASAMTDSPLAAERVELLRLAAEAASAMPLQPHVKNRSRAQESVVEACLELEQPERAREASNSIANWRRGSAFAALAVYCAERDDSTGAREWLDRAQTVLAGPIDEEEQTWRFDRIRGKMACAHLLLGDEKAAEKLELGLEASERLEVEGARSRLTPSDRFDERIAALNALLPNGSFEQTQLAIASGTALFDRFYAEPERRSAAESVVRSAWTKLPVLVRIEATEELARIALEHGDRAGAKILADELREVVDGAKWLPEDFVPWQSKVASLMHDVGDDVQARELVTRARERYFESRDMIVDIYRSGALRPLAEAYASLGDTAQALEIWALAVEEGVHNPNSRPRAEDLAATCLSIARSGIDPDAALLARLREVRAGLSAPW